MREWRFGFAGGVIAVLCSANAFAQETGKQVLDAEALPWLQQKAPAEDGLAPVISGEGAADVPAVEGPPAVVIRKKKLSLPSSGAAKETLVETIAFDKPVLKLTPVQEKVLKETFGAQADKKTWRMQLVSHAAVRENYPNEARRIALKRALEVRNTLKELGFTERNVMVKVLVNDDPNQINAPEKIEIFRLP